MSRKMQCRCFICVKKAINIALLFRDSESTLVTPKPKDLRDALLDNFWTTHKSKSREVSELPARKLRPVILITNQLNSCSESASVIFIVVQT